MLLRQIEYFQAVVRAGSFYGAAETCGVSQSAISQQIKKLESELGTALLERHNRSFSLTSAGEVFWRKSLAVTGDIELMIRETRMVSGACDGQRLRVGFYKGYLGSELEHALGQLAQERHDVDISVMAAGHEELYRGMEGRTIDVALNDMRRAFSSAYRNVILAKGSVTIELTCDSPLAQLSGVEAPDLRSMPCVLVGSGAEQRHEEDYYRDVIGIVSPVVFVATMQEARLMAASGQGYLLADVLPSTAPPRASLVRLPLLRAGDPIEKTYCLFWKKDATTPLIERFAELLQQQFA